MYGVFGRGITKYIGLDRTVHGISMYCVYAAYDHIYVAFPYILYTRENGITQN